jgi:hypothetical protein
LEFVMRKYDSDRNGSLDVYEFGSLVEDLRVNTAESVKERFSLRTHKKVEAALKLWSKAVWRSMEGDPRRLTDEQGEASTSSTSALGLGRAQYIDLMRRIIQTLRPELGKEEATSVAEEDWSHDRAGDDEAAEEETLSADLLRDSLFECSLLALQPPPLSATLPRSALACLDRMFGELT